MTKRKIEKFARATDVLDCASSIFQRRRSLAQDAMGCLGEAVHEWSPASLGIRKCPDAISLGKPPAGEGRAKNSRGSPGAARARENVDRGGRRRTF